MQICIKFNRLKMFDKKVACYKIQMCEQRNKYEFEN